MNIYYPIAKKLIKRAARCLSAVLIVSLSVLTFPSKAFADFRDNASEDYRVKGYEEQQKGNYEKALGLYVKALSLSPDNPVIFNDMGVVYEQAGMEDQAQKCYLDAIRVDKSYLPPYMNLAYLFEKKGDIARAVEYFEKRVKLGKKNDRWTKKAQEEVDRLSRGRGEDLKKQESERLARELVEQARKEFIMQIVRADQHYKKGLKFFNRRMYSEALEQYDQALALTPDNPKVLRARNEVAEEQKKRDIHQRTEQALKMLEAGDVESAKEEYHKILATLPNESTQQSE